jgi:branched-chain amino acid transport system permease protein
VVIHPSEFFIGPPVILGGVFIDRQEIVVWITTIIVTLGLIGFFQATDLGRRVRAAVDSRPSARLLGIRVNWYMTGAFAAAAALAGLAAFVVAPTQGVSYDGGDIIAIKGFLAVAIGGLGSYVGGVIGALVVALVEAYTARYWNAENQQTVILAGFIVVLYIRAIGTPLWLDNLWARARRRLGRRETAATSTAGVNQ